MLNRPGYFPTLAPDGRLADRLRERRVERLAQFLVVTGRCVALRIWRGVSAPAV